MIQRNKKQIPRGIRNNNPLNIRIGNTWLGESPTPLDSDFEVFVSMKYGIRAAFIILRRYIKKYNRNTIRKIITAWAPASENNTERYISFVADQVGIDADTIISCSDEHEMIALVMAMAQYENGQPIKQSEVEKVYNIVFR